MNTNQLPPWTHHSILLWDAREGLHPLTDEARKLSAQAKRMKLAQTTKEATKAAFGLNRLLSMDQRHEALLCVANPHFFADVAELAPRRKDIFKLMRETQRLRWLVFVDALDTVGTMLPSDWGSTGYGNVCFALHVETADAAAMERIEQFKVIPAACRMLHVAPLAQPLDLAGKLKGIHWITSDGGPPSATGDDDLSLKFSRALKDACMQADTAFFFHRDGVVLELEGHEYRNHPFGSNLNLARAPLKDSRMSAGPVVAASATPAPVGEPTGKTDPAASPRVTGAGSGSSSQAKPLNLPAIQPSPDKVSAEPLSNPPGPSATKSAKMTRSEKPSKPAEHVEVEVVTDSTVVAHVPEIVAVGKMKPADMREFQRLDGIVRRAAEMFSEAGRALQEIRERELWRAGNFDSWAAYCRQAAGLSKVHANRLIAAAGIVEVIAKVEPIGSTPSPRLIPRSESQMRALGAIADPQQQVRAWELAVEHSAGDQPTAGIVKRAVAEILEKQDKQSKPAPEPPKQTRAERRVDVLARMKAAVEARKNWDLVAKLVIELEDLV